MGARKWAEIRRRRVPVPHPECKSSHNFDEHLNMLGYLEHALEALGRQEFEEAKEVLIKAIDRIVKPSEYE